MENETQGEPSEMKKHGNSNSMKISKYKINPSVADVLSKKQCKKK